MQAFVALPLEVYSVTIFIQLNFLQISLPASDPQILASRDYCYHPQKTGDAKITWPLSTTFFPLQMDHPKSRFIYLVPAFEGVVINPLLNKCVA